MNRVDPDVTADETFTTKTLKKEPVDFRMGYKAGALEMLAFMRKGAEIETAEGRMLDQLVENLTKGKAVKEATGAFE